MSTNDSKAPENLNKRLYNNRAYAETKGRLQDAYLWLIDRMWPFPDEKDNRQGYVMPAFVSVRRMQEDKGGDWRTWDQHVRTLVDQGLITIRGDYERTSGRWEYTSIYILPPDECNDDAWPTFLKDRHAGHADFENGCFFCRLREHDENHVAANKPQDGCFRCDQWQEELAAKHEQEREREQLGREREQRREREEREEAETNELRAKEHDAGQHNERRDRNCDQCREDQHREDHEAGLHAQLDRRGQPKRAYGCPLCV